MSLNETVDDIVKDSRTPDKSLLVMFAVQTNDNVRFNAFME